MKYIIDEDFLDPETFAHADATGNLQELVMCKECKHSCGRGRGIYCQFIQCGKTGAFHKEDWFCGDGKVK